MPVFLLPKNATFPNSNFTKIEDLFEKQLWLMLVSYLETVVYLVSYAS